MVVRTSKINLSDTGIKTGITQIMSTLILLAAIPSPRRQAKNKCCQCATTCDSLVHYIKYSSFTGEVIGFRILLSYFTVLDITHEHVYYW